MSLKRKAHDIFVRDSSIKKSKTKEIARSFKITSFTNDNIKAFMRKNSNEINIVKLRYESNDFRTVEYMSCKNTKFLREFFDSGRLGQSTRIQQRQAIPYRRVFFG